MHLFFDTETTGMAKFGAPPEDPAQPHLVQLGAILCDADGRVRAEMNLLIKPDGWTIEPQAQAVHGISVEQCEEFGVSRKAALLLFYRMAMSARKLVAHNIEFDLLVLRAALHRASVDPTWLDSGKLAWTCTMKDATNVLQIPGKRGGFKWPNLAEAHRHLLGCDFDGAHDAMEDVRACKRVFYALQERQRPAAGTSAPPVAPAPQELFEGATSPSKPGHAN